MGKLAFSVGKVLGKDKTRKVFHMKSHETKYDLIDVIIRETIPLLQDNTTDSNAGRQQTYWRQANAIAGIDLEEEASLVGMSYKRLMNTG